VVALKTLHIFGAIFMVGGVTAHVLLRPLATRASNDVRIGLYHLAWRIQVLMVYLGSGLVRAFQAAHRMVAARLSSVRGRRWAGRRIPITQSAPDARLP